MSAERPDASPPAPGRGALRASMQRQPRCRRRIAFLADYMNAYSEGYEEQVRVAIDEECVRSDLDLLLVYGRPVFGATAESAAHNAIFELVTECSADAVIVLAGPLSSVAGQEGMERFLERYEGIPRCSLGLAIAGVPSVLVDGGSAIRGLVEHLVVVHECTRPAFVGGPPNVAEAQERLAAYRDVLESRGCYEPARVVCGHFTQSGGAAAIEELMRRGVPFDSVVAANDSMALGVRAALRERMGPTFRGLPITGFDDLAVSRWEHPPLTTAAQPSREMARRAIRAIQAQWEGQHATAAVVLSPRLLFRESCGCARETPFAQDAPARLAPAESPVVQHSRSSAGPACASRSPSRADSMTRLRIVLLHSLDGSSVDAEGVADLLVRVIFEEIDGERGALGRALELLLPTCDAQCAMALQSVFSTLRREVCRDSTSAMEDVWHQARDTIALATSSKLAHALLEHQLFNARLLASNERLSAALDPQSLSKVMLEVLPSLGVDTAYVARLTAGSDAPELAPVMAMVDGVSLEGLRRAHSARELLPAEFATNARRTLAVFPLTHEAQCHGIVGFGYSRSVQGHSLIRDQIAGALRAVLLHQDVVERTLLHDRSIQARLTAGRQLQALSLLAGSVAHDLNNVLGPLVALPDVIIANVARLPIPDSCGAELRADAEAIKQGGLRAAQTVKDLMTLGRQAHTSNQVVNMAALVRAKCEEIAAAARSAGGTPVRISFEAAQDFIAVRGSETQLSRAVGALLLHACRSSPNSTHVAIAVAAADLKETLRGHEVIAPGSYATVCVTDQGGGFEELQLATIFEPHYGGNRAAADAGLGLGLALVHVIVKEHGGFIDARTRLGEGTTFTVYLPRTDERPRSPEAELPVAPVAARVLVVDDEALQLRTSRRILELLGYEVDVVDSGTKALELFRSAVSSGVSPYDLVVMDMILNEERDGLEVLEVIRGMFPAQRGIVVSGHAPRERLERAGERGVIWLGKPYTTDALAGAVAAGLRDAP